jgi:DNA-binding response OmpR family regulator
MTAPGTSLRLMQAGQANEPVASVPRDAVDLRILVVGDVAAQTGSLRALGRAGHELLAVDASERPTRLLGVFDPELIVIAASTNGIAICRALRVAAPDHGILMLAPSTDPAERIAALQAGANDCLATPFQPAELLARVEAVWRRTRRHRTGAGQQASTSERSKE